MLIENEKTLEIGWAQCCKLWPVLQGCWIHKCGICHRYPIYLPALGHFTITRDGDYNDG